MTKARAVWTFLVFGILPAIALAEPSDAPMLVLDHVHKIADRSAGFSEPSGLALGSDGDEYWSVSDDSAMIYRLTPKGKLVPDQSIPLPMKGLEGVVDDLVRNRLLTVREDTAEIVAVSLMDGASTAYPITRMSGFGDIAAVFGSVRSNNGLEGISLGSSTDEIVVIKENGPRLLIRISADLSTILGAVELTAVRGFACDGTDDMGLDVSDLTFDAARKARNVPPGRAIIASANSAVGATWAIQGLSGGNDGRICDLLWDIRACRVQTGLYPAAMK